MTLTSKPLATEKQANVNLKLSEVILEMQSCEQQSHKTVSPAVRLHIEICPDASFSFQVYLHGAK